MLMDMLVKFMGTWLPGLPLDCLFCGYLRMMYDMQMYCLHEDFVPATRVMFSLN